jgi:tRNA(fMet)-specific endonuclease VapC
VELALVRLLLDTNRYTDLVEHDAAVVERFTQASQVWLSLITLGELRSGFLQGKRADRNERLLADMLTVRGVEVLLPDQETSTYYGRIHAGLKCAGQMIPTNDVWIAALALQHNLTLDTRDSHFRKVPGLRLVGL